MIRKALLAAALAPVLFAGCASQPPASATSVADAIAHDPQLSTLNTLVAKAGLATTLKAAGPYTVFAPTNAAFKAVPEKTLAELGNDPAKLKQVLSFHVLPAKVMAGEARGKLKTAHGASVAVARAGDFITVEEAMVETADIPAGNGVIHKVDRVLMPPRK